MLFTSVQFICFFIVVLVLVFGLPQRFRWMVLLAASLYFYVCWNYKYVVFLIFVIVVDYISAIGMDRSATLAGRRAMLALSLTGNLGLLFTFKYFNFFSHTLSYLIRHQLPTLALLLPLGISFHVFQSLAYTIDVYRRRQAAEYHFGKFALYVTFFPQLVAGPIERPQNLLNQFHGKRHVSYESVRSGALLALWGMMKKLCIADLISKVVNTVYDNPQGHSGPILFLATFFFAVQIYCDFSGYTDIARGVARIMGYELMLNFRQPYFARSIREFWQRWHISLSTWFRDYVYIPLGGSRVKRRTHYRNLFVVFLVSGLWHGAGWTFVIWGALHGIYMIVGDATRSIRQRTACLVMSEHSVARAAVQIVITLQLVMVGWVFFRAESFGKAIYILGHMYIPERIRLQDLLNGLGLPRMETVLSFAMIGLLITIDSILVCRPEGVLRLWNVRAFRWAAYATGFYALVFFGVWEQIQFIYFQF